MAETKCGIALDFSISFIGDGPPRARINGKGEVTYAALSANKNHEIIVNLISKDGKKEKSCPIDEFCLNNSGLTITIYHGYFSEAQKVHLKSLGINNLFLKLLETSVYN